MEQRIMGENKYFLKKKKKTENPIQKPTLFLQTKNVMIPKIKSVSQNMEQNIDSKKKAKTIKITDSKKKETASSFLKPSINISNCPEQKPTKVLCVTYLICE